MNRRPRTAVLNPTPNTAVLVYRCGASVLDTLGPLSFRFPRSSRGVWECGPKPILPVQTAVWTRAIRHPQAVIEAASAFIANLGEREREGYSAPSGRDLQRNLNPSSLLRVWTRASRRFAGAKSYECHGSHSSVTGVTDDSWCVALGLTAIRRGRVVQCHGGAVWAIQVRRLTPDA